MLVINDAKRIAADYQAVTCSKASRNILREINPDFLLLIRLSGKSRNLLPDVLTVKLSGLYHLFLEKRIFTAFLNLRIVFPFRDLPGIVFSRQLTDPMCKCSLFRIRPRISVRKLCFKSWGHRAVQPAAGSGCTRLRMFIRCSHPHSPPSDTCAQCFQALCKCRVLTRIQKIDRRYSELLQ